jgi:CheY-like chemotaxis protein
LVLAVRILDESSASFLREIKSHEASDRIPVLAVTSSDYTHKAIDSGADDACTDPAHRQWLLGRLRDLAGRPSIEMALIIDDREPDRYLVKEALLALGQLKVIEAETGHEAFGLLESMRPDVIFLDLVLPDMTGFEVLDRLKSESQTRKIPVIINTSRILDEDERNRLSAKAVDILAKESKSREDAIARIRGSLQKAGLNP